MTICFQLYTESDKCFPFFLLCLTLLKTNTLNELSSMLPKALTGPHFYTWGDHGGLLVAIAQGGSSTHLK